MPSPATALNQFLSPEQTLPIFGATLGSADDAGAQLLHSAHGRSSRGDRGDPTEAARIMKLPFFLEHERNHPGL